MVEMEVEIYGKKYLLRGTDAEEIKAVARLVDLRLRELFGAEPRPLDPSKAVALAINFAEEIYQREKESVRMEQEFSEKLDRLLKKVAGLEKLIEL